MKPPSEIRLLSIDAATKTCGYAVFSQQIGQSPVLIAAGNIFGGEGDMTSRMKEIRDEVKHLIATHEPNALAVEDLKFNRGTPNLSSMTKVAFAIGAILSAYGEEDIIHPVVMIAANSVRASWAVKQTKPALRAAVNKRFLKNLVDIGFSNGLIKKHEDISDAIGLGVVALSKVVGELYNQ